MIEAHGCVGWTLSPIKIKADLRSDTPTPSLLKTIINSLRFNIHISSDTTTII